MLSLQGYLASGRAASEARVVGQTLTLELDAAKYEPKVVFDTPQEDSAGTLAVDAVAVNDRLQVTIADTTKSGIYKAQLRTVDGKSEERFFAYNVDADEGALRTLSGEQLARHLEGLEYEFH